jgi:LDH2 family malate/lactate/ureidoglycolate dehydrogenase
MPTLTHSFLTELGLRLIEAAGTPPDIAGAVSTSLVEANLRGHDSHGVLRIPWYIDLIRNGRIRPQEQPLIIRRQGATACVDGQLGWGLPAARLAARTAIEIAGESGVGAVSLVRTNHIGRVGEYVELIAQAGLIGIAFCNASRSVAPYGSSQRLIGTNPFAWAAPRGPGQPPLVLDFATSSVAEGKLRVARASGQPIPLGLIVDSQGLPSEDPADFYNGGTLQTFGQHKGSGLSLMIELLARGLAGVDFGKPEYSGFNGTIMLALRIESFASAGDYLAAAEGLCSDVMQARPLPGVDEVLLPGQPELRMRERRLVDGIPLAESTWETLVAAAGELGVEIQNCRTAEL